MTADDVRKVRFAMALRGYRMGDVDWALERMADEVDRLRGRVAALSGELPPGDGQPALTDDEGHQLADTRVDTGTGSVLSGAARDRLGRHLRSDPDETG